MPSKHVCHGKMSPLTCIVLEKDVLEHKRIKVIQIESTTFVGHGIIPHLGVLDNDIRGKGGQVTCSGDVKPSPVPCGVTIDLAPLQVETPSNDFDAATSDAAPVIVVHRIGGLVIRCSADDAPCKDGASILHRKKHLIRDSWAWGRVRLDRHES